MSYFDVCTYKEPKGVPFSCQLRGDIDCRWNGKGPRLKVAMRYKCGHCRRGNVAILRIAENWTGWEFRRTCHVCHAQVVVGMPQMHLWASDVKRRIVPPRDPYREGP